MDVKEQKLSRAFQNLRKFLLKPIRENLRSRNFSRVFSFILSFFSAHSPEKLRLIFLFENIVVKITLMLSFLGSVISQQSKKE